MVELTATGRNPPIPSARLSVELRKSSIIVPLVPHIDFASASIVPY